ncbi:MAG TPA: hypothetical protein VJY85_01390, partial [Candidatus Limnocylindria bacterium]|nr:hypothetical protein [Candidatus Limnocylindria bacterium]
MHTPAARRGAPLVAMLLLLAGCINLNPSPEPSASGATPSSGETPGESPTGVPSPTDAASPTPALPAQFPLAVVTGITNLKPTIALDELPALAARGRLLVPCGVAVQQPQLTAPAACRAA